MSMTAKTILLALLVLPGTAAAEGEPSASTRQTGATRPEVRAETKIAAGTNPIRCRIYFGCAPLARTASDIAHPVPERRP